MLTSITISIFSMSISRNIVLEDEYFFNDNNVCTKVTDAWGNKPKTIWKTHVRA